MDNQTQKAERDLIIEKLDRLVDEAKSTRETMQTISGNIGDLQEMIAVYKNGKATFWTFYTIGKVMMFIAGLVGACIATWATVIHTKG